MDRNGHRSGADRPHANRDSYCDLRTDGDGHASAPDPQPDSVDRNGHHHPDLYLHPNAHVHAHGNLHPNRHTNPDTLPAGNRDLYAFLHSVEHSDPDTVQYAFLDSKSHLHHVIWNRHPFHYPLPYNPIT